MFSATSGWWPLKQGRDDSKEGKDAYLGGPSANDAPGGTGVETSSQSDRASSGRPLLFCWWASENSEIDWNFFAVLSFVVATILEASVVFHDEKWKIKPTIATYSEK